MKKVWTPAMRAAFAAKMKRARAAKGARRKNPKKRVTRVKKTRVARVRRVRRKNPLVEYEIKMGKSLQSLRKVWTTHTPSDAKFIARTFAKANPRMYVTVKKK